MQSLSVCIFTSESRFGDPLPGLLPARGPRVLVGDDVELEGHRELSLCALLVSSVLASHFGGHRIHERLACLQFTFYSGIFFA